MSPRALWTFPGKIGDTFLQWPVARAWSRAKGVKVHVGVSELVEPILPILRLQPEVEEAHVIPGRIADWSVGGQPNDFGFTWEDYLEWDQVFHCGMLAFPNCQISRFTAACLRVPVPDGILEEPSLYLPGDYPRQSLCVLHGRRVSQSGGDPRFWGLVGGLVRGKKLDRFEKVMAVGTPEEVRDARNRMGVNAYLDDKGDWMKLAEFLKSASLVIDAGTGVAALAGALGVPCIRVHDPIGTYDRRIWSNPQKNQMNLGPEEGEKRILEFMEEHCANPRLADRPADRSEYENLASPELGPQGLETVIAPVRGAE